MIKIDFSYSGGFPFTQGVFDKMQKSYLDILISLVGFLGIPNTGSHILFGCEISGSNITSGMMFIDGELCSFSQVAGNNSTKIKKLATITNEPFQNGNNNPVYRHTTAVIDESGVALSSFTRKASELVYDGNYVHTDNNFTALLLNKLNSIETGAEVNVQSNWNAVNPASDAFIQNKPDILPVLWRSFYDVGDVTGIDYLVTFPSLETTNYSVFVSFETAATNAVQSATYIYVIHSKTQTSFKVRFNETGAHVQSLKMNYLIIRN